jgi:quinol monooxygenase YgiN
MSVKVLLEFQAKADQVDNIKKFLRSELPDTRGYDGFESLTMHQSDDNPTRFLFWSSGRPARTMRRTWRGERKPAS